MDNETKQMFELILGKFGKMDSRFDKIETRLDNMGKEFKEFKLEMKEEHKRVDGKLDLIYAKLTAGMEEIKNKPEPIFKIVKDD